MHPSSCTTSHYWVNGLCCGFEASEIAKNISCSDGIKESSRMEKQVSPSTLHRVTVKKEFPAEGNAFKQVYENMTPSAYHKLLECVVNSTNSQEFSECERVFTHLFATYREKNTAISECEKQYKQCRYKTPWSFTAPARGIAQDNYNRCRNTNPEHKKWEQCVEDVNKIPLKKCNGADE